MRHPLILGLLWAATLVLAWLLGASFGRRADEDSTRTPPPRTEVSVVRTGERAPRLQAGTERTLPDPERPAPEEVAREPIDPGTVEPVPDGTFTLAGVATLDEASALFMRYVAVKLAQGPEGHKELWRTIDALGRDQNNQHIFRQLRREEDAAHLLYPWIRFLVDHERQVVAMMETLYRTAAEDPAWFEGLDDDPLELFTEGMAFILPGVVSETGLSRMRAHVERILAMPPDTLPKALKNNLRELQRNLEWWAPRLTGDELRAQLRDPEIRIGTRLALLSRARPEDLAGFDTVAVLAEGIRAGEREAMPLLRRQRLGAPDLVVLDQALLDAAANGRLHAWLVNNYVSATGRETWGETQPLIETGLAMGQPQADVFAESLCWLPEKPDKVYVHALLDRYPLSDRVRRVLRQRFGID